MSGTEPKPLTQPSLYETILPADLLAIVGHTILGRQQDDGLRIVTVGPQVLLYVLGHGGIGRWNELMATWQHWICPAWAEGESSPDVMIEMDFSDIHLSGYLLDEINLRFAWLEHTDFRGASLRRAALDLTCISETDFTGAVLEETSFVTAFYRRNHPPLGLTPELLAENEVCPDEW